MIPPHSKAKSPRNYFVALMRKIYNPLGFANGYNFVFYVVLCGALMGFVLARFMYLDIDNNFCTLKGTLPGECYYLQSGRGRIGILLHLGAILPAGFLVVFQFTPILRHKFLIVHRICGYIVLILALASTAGVLMITRNALGGSIAFQTAVGLSSIMFVGSLALAYYNVKRLQIEQHRAWMLRAWVYAGYIITMRLIGFIITRITSPTGEYYEARPCYLLDYIYGGNQTVVSYLYPDCSKYYSGKNPGQQVLVKSDFNAKLPDQIAVGLTVAFTGSTWVALAIHAIGVEIYLHLTTSESERLRQYSYKRQVEAGFKNPGNGGTTAQRLGDAPPWVPEQPELTEILEHEQKRSG